MDSDLNVAHHIAAFKKWEQEHTDEVNEVGLEFVEATDTSLDFKANGILFQLVFPTDAGQEETFVAMNLDNAAPESFLLGLNEKLERVRGGSWALSNVFDSLYKVFASYEGQKTRRNLSAGVVPSSIAPVSIGLDDYDDSDVDSEDTDSHGDEGFSAFGLDVNRIFGQSLEDFEKHLNIETSGEFISHEDYLPCVAMEAKEMCKAVRQVHQNGEIYPDSDMQQVFGSVTPSEMHDIIRYFQVSLLPKHFCVRLQMEAAGVFNDARMASALGFSFHNCVNLFITFNGRFWFQGSSGDLVPTGVVVKTAASMASVGPSKHCISSESSLNISENGTDNEFETDCKRFSQRQKTMVYGTDVLLPELVSLYFKYRRDRTFEVLKSKRWDNDSLDTALQDFAGVVNPLVGLMCFIGTQLRALPSWCLICWSKLPASVWSLSTCEDELCLYEFEELGLGFTIYQRIQDSPEVVDIELSLACAAANPERDVFEPYPTFLLSEKEMRRRCGWFSKPSGPPVQKRASVTDLTSGEGLTGSLLAAANAVPAVASTIVASASSLTATNAVFLTTAAPASLGISSTSIALSEKQNKKLILLRDILQSIPRIADLKVCSDENELKRGLSRAALTWYRKETNKKETDSSYPESRKIGFSYDLMKFILSTNRLSLLHISSEDEFKLSFSSKYQFVVLHDSPEKEAKFKERKAQRGGSFFAFHGSKLSNWYSILRNGLRSMSNTHYMSTGASYGQGIYLASDLGLSSAYATGTESAYLWKNGSLESGMVVMAICEVVLGSTTDVGDTKTGRIFVVPPDKEDDVSVRYLLVSESQAVLQKHMKGARDYCRIRGSILSSSKLKVNLDEHYQSLKLQDYNRQQQLLTISRLEALRRVSLQVDPQAINDLTISQATTDSMCATSLKSMETAICSSPESARGDFDGGQGLHSSCSAPVKMVEQAQSSSLKIAKDSSGQEGKAGDMVVNTLKKRPINDSQPLESKRATQTISKAFRQLQTEIRKAKEIICNSGGDSFLANVTIVVPDEADLYLWHVQLHQNVFRSQPTLYKDLQKVYCEVDGKESNVLLEVLFSGCYPFQPPFVRIIRPKFTFHTGHVTVGGSICIELLTNSGWLPSYSMESVLVQIVNAIVEGEGRIDMSALGQEYSQQAAREAFTRVARLHGWEMA